MNLVTNYLNSENTTNIYNKSNSKMRRLLLKLEKNRVKEKNRQFHNWLDTELDLNNYHHNDHGQLCGGKEENFIKINTIINNFIDELKTIIVKEGYQIDNQNQFKDEIASFLYKESI